LKLTIRVIDPSGVQTFLEKEIMVGDGINSSAASHFSREIDIIKLEPGFYRITVQSLKDIPELANTKVVFAIYSSRGK
jgi:hypothetical protein